MKRDSYRWSHPLRSLALCRNLIALHSPFARHHLTSWSCPAPWLYLIIYMAFLAFPAGVHADTQEQEIEKMLSKLDKQLQRESEFQIAKELRIHQCRTKLLKATTPEAQYMARRELYQEYFVFESDSALHLLQLNQQLATRLGRRDWVNQCEIEKSFIYTATGMLTKAEASLDQVETQILDTATLINYYEQRSFLYSHRVQYEGAKDGDWNNRYQVLKVSYRDSIAAIQPTGHPLYLWNAGWLAHDLSKGIDEMIPKLREVVDASALTTREDAQMAYILARLYEKKGDEYHKIYYLVQSAMADIRICNREIASLIDLMIHLFRRGDIDHAYLYSSYCFKQAQLYKNRIRILDMMLVMDKIYHSYQERNDAQQQRLTLYSVVLGICTLVLLVTLYYVIWLVRRLIKRRRQLKESNVQLTEHVQELSKTRKRLTEAHNQLTSQNVQLKEAVEQLKALKQKQEETLLQLQESNYVKEEYIGYVFAICSNYIEKINSYRKMVNRKITAGQLTELKQLTDTPSSIQSELKEFYHYFDSIFLNVYPNFISDFNALLRPEEQIAPREGELLNTDLRIYALVRLGINDSVKIAEFLHCSPQTVYNNRLKIRNKAIVPKEDFAKIVASLGKYEEGKL